MATPQTREVEFHLKQNSYRRDDKQIVYFDMVGEIEFGDTFVSATDGGCEYFFPIQQIVHIRLFSVDKSDEENIEETPSDVTEEIPEPATVEEPVEEPQEAVMLEFNRIERLIGGSKDNRPKFVAHLEDGKGHNDKLYFNLHLDNPEFDSAKILTTSDVAKEILTMSNGDELTWHGDGPIIEAVKDGKFWKPLKIAQQGGTVAKHFSNHSERREQVINACQKLLEIEDVIILDLESTGVGKTDEITEIAWLIPATGETFQSLVRPTDPNMVTVPGTSGIKAVDLNGITPEMLADAPTLSELQDHIKTILGKRIVGHNIDFDLRLLQQSIAVSKVDFLFSAYSNKEALKANDTMHLVGKFIKDKSPFKSGDYRWISLAEAARLFNIEVDGTAHRAMRDVRLTWKLVQTIAAIEEKLIQRMPF